MGRQWYNFYPGDYGRDTGHLSLVEHGAYRALMDHYYATGAPLPPEEARLLRLCRAYTREEEAAVRFVLGEFFQAGEGGFRHPRIDEEIVKAAEQSARNSVAGKISNARRRAIGMPKAQGREVCVPTENAPPQPHPKPQEKNMNRGVADSGFDEFWNAYPRREARALARRAYANAIAKASPEALIAGARDYAARRQGQDANFTRLPSTWLAQECWLDDVGAAADDAPCADALGQKWEGRAAGLVQEIGAAQFQAYFGEALFDAGPPPRITVDAPYRKDLIQRKFSAALSRAFGEFVLEVSP